MYSLIASAIAMLCRTLALAILLWQREGLKVLSFRGIVYSGIGNDEAKTSAFPKRL